VAVEPDEPETVVAQARDNGLLTVAVARQHYGHDTVGPSSRDLPGQLPIEVKARGNLRGPGLSQ
jgi:hypothetical protein